MILVLYWGHFAVRRLDHIDNLQDGNLQHMHQDHVDEHVLEVSGKNPDHCTPNHQCNGHDADLIHGSGCGHETLPHGNHIDYLVNGHLHHVHNGHCDDMVH